MKDFQTVKGKIRDMKITEAIGLGVTLVFVGFMSFFFSSLAFSF